MKHKIDIIVTEKEYVPFLNIDFNGFHKITDIPKNPDGSDIMSGESIEKVIKIAEMSGYDPDVHQFWLKISVKPEIFIQTCTYVGED